MKHIPKRGLALVCLLVLCGTGGLPSVRADDAWMSKVALYELARVSDSDGFDKLSDRVKGAVLGRLSVSEVKDLTVMTDLLYVLRACRYGKIAAELKFKRNATEAKLAARSGLFKDGDELFRWLVANRGLSRVLFRGMQDVDDPIVSLKTIAELKAVGDKALMLHAELATALATSRAGRCYQKQLDPASVVDVFKYYTTRRMRHDLKTMPYELSRYIVDSKLGIKERQWAYGKYFRYANPAKSYFDLKYDIAHLEKGDPKKISKLPFTLQNLRKVGGVCIEQAYFSSEVCKAVGVPAAIVGGRSGEGIYHAWTMCFVMNRGRRSASWDSSTGRYEEQKYLVGAVTNPASGRRLLDSEAALEGAAALLSPARREDADTATGLAILAADVANARRLASLDDLKALAVMYKERFNSSPVDTESLEASIKIDMMMVERFLASALNCNLAHRPAWEFIIELRVNRDMLKVSRLAKFFDVLTSKTAKSYPDYSCEMLLRIAPSIPDPAARMKIYQNALGVYASRRDLQGRILIACGDDYAGRDKPEAALKFYQTAALKNVDLASIVTEASGRAEKLLVDAGHPKHAVAMYSKLFKTAKKPRRASPAFTRQNSYYILGQRLAVLLEATGEAKRAEKIRKLITR